MPVRSNGVAFSGHAQPDDWLSRAGAIELAFRVRDFWQQHGAAVEVRVEKVVRGSGTTTIYGLKSNLDLFLPPRQETTGK